MSPIAVATFAVLSLNEARDKASARRLQSGHAFANKAALLVARDAWLSNPTAAAATYGAIGTWDTSRITDLSFVFCGLSCLGRGWCTDCNTACTSFNDDISGWDVSNVVNMDGTFAEAHAFNQPLNNWNTARVTTLWNTFQEARAFNQPLDNWNTARVSSMSSTFTNANALSGTFGGANALSDCNKALIASTWSASSVWSSSSWASWSSDTSICPSPPPPPPPPPPPSPLPPPPADYTGLGIGIGVGAPALLVACAIVRYIVKKWQHNQELKRKVAPDMVAA